MEKEEKNIKKKFEINPKTKKIIDIVLFIATPAILLGLMILFFNYTSEIWYYLKPKPIILTLFLLELIHILLTGLTRK